MITYTESSVNEVTPTLVFLSKYHKILLEYSTV